MSVFRIHPRKSAKDPYRAGNFQLVSELENQSELAPRLEDQSELAPRLVYQSE